MRQSRVRGALTVTSRLHETIHRPTRPHRQERRTQRRPNGHRNALRVRLSNAIQSRKRIPIAHHEETALQKHCLRVAVVHSRRHVHRLPTRARRAHLGRMGGRVRKTRRNLRLPVAQVANFIRWAH